MSENNQGLENEAVEGSFTKKIVSGIKSFAARSNHEADNHRHAGRRYDKDEKGNPISVDHEPSTVGFSGIQSDETTTAPTNEKVINLEQWKREHNK